MGCNAALNGLNAAATWAVANRGRYALLVCCEINSAIHVNDDGVVTALVNSLFGDGCGAMVLASGDAPGTGPEVLGLSSRVVPQAGARSGINGLGASTVRALPGQGHSERSRDALAGADHRPLDEVGLCRCDIKHWLVHAGGRKVISAIGDANGLTPHDLRHATSVLRRYGNLGSPTVMFSYEALLNEDTIAAGDYGLMVTMGPGATIETALVRW